MSYLKSSGGQADSVLPLTWGLLVISILVVVVITALVLWSMFRSRPEAGEDLHHAEPRQEHSFTVFGVGLGITTIILIACIGWTMATLGAIAKPDKKPAVTVEITGKQWWWAVRYVSDVPSEVFITANEIHIPTGVPVELRLRSGDVIHSFWVPKLSGKTDLIPGQINTTWIQANQPGTYLGQCAEFCGPQHAHMSIRIIAETPQKFVAWRENQLQPPPRPAVADAKTGLNTFEQRCAACHTVRGTEAGGVYGPDLSHLMTRDTLADGTIPNKPGYLAGWIADPQDVKPGTKMPRVHLSGNELQSVTAFLKTLK